MIQVKPFAVTLAAIFLSINLYGCALQNVEPPQTANEGAAYAGATVQSVQQTAIAQYPFMTKAQATEVHEQIAQAVAIRTDLVAALLAGDQATADTKLARLQNILAIAQGLLAKYGEQK